MELGSGCAIAVLRGSTLERTLSRPFGAGFAAGFAFKPSDLDLLEDRATAFFGVLFLDFGLAMIRVSSLETAELIKVVVFKVKRPTPPVEEELLW